VFLTLYFEEFKVNIIKPFVLFLVLFNPDMSKIFFFGIFVSCTTQRADE